MGVPPSLPKLFTLQFLGVLNVLLELILSKEKQKQTRKKNSDNIRLTDIHHLTFSSLLPIYESTKIHPYYLFGKMTLRKQQNEAQKTITTHDIFEREWELPRLASELSLCSRQNSPFEKVTVLTAINRFFTSIIASVGSYFFDNLHVTCYMKMAASTYCSCQTSFKMFHTKAGTVTTRAAIQLLTNDTEVSAGKKFKCLRKITWFICTSSRNNKLTTMLRRLMLEMLLLVKYSGQLLLHYCHLASWGRSSSWKFAVNTYVPRVIFKE